LFNSDITSLPFGKLGAAAASEGNSFQDVLDVKIDGKELDKNLDNP